MMKSIEVGCGIIHKNGKLLIAQRMPGSYLGGFWEFPGGKIEPGETMEECLIREIREELGIEIRPCFFLRKDSYVYPEKTVVLHFYLCEWVAGNPSRQHCLAFRWVEPERLRDFRFPLGDDAMIQDLILKRNFYFGKNVRNGFKREVT